MRKHTIIAIAMASVGVIGIVAAIATHGNVRDHIAKTYRFTGEEPAPGGGKTKTKTYTSSKPVGRTAADIADAHKPADRRITESGAFLRYSDDVVSVVPAATGQSGSRILVDDEAGGYHRNYLFVGGFWGTYSGPAGSFRGGGPGSGK
jgi:hypothetical protein